MSDSDLPNGAMKKWVYQNIATILLTVTIGLSSFVWQDLVTSMEKMRTDIRALTAKINEVVENQASQREIIDGNRQDIRDIEKRLRGLDRNWREQWRDNSKPQNGNP